MPEGQPLNIQTIEQDIKKGKRKPEVSFFFSAHGNLEDYTGIEQELSDADVFVVESHGWNEEDLQYLQEISNGIKEPKHITENRPPKDVLEYEEELLYKTNKKVEIIDVPEGHELDKKDDGTGEYINIVGRFISNGDLSEALEALKESTQQNASYLDEKDKYLEGRLRDLLEQLQKEHEKMPKVLVQMGSSHINFSHSFRRSKEGKISQNTIKYDFLDELVRHYRFNKEPSNELITRALAEEIILQLFGEELSHVPYLKRNTFFRQLLTKLDDSDLTEIGRQTESEYFQKVIMNNEDDNLELNRSILNNAWKNITGIDLLSEINNLISEQDN